MKSRIKFSVAFIILFLIGACESKGSNKQREKEKSKLKRTALINAQKKVSQYSIKIDEIGLHGVYKGVEFTDTGNYMYNDVAHQFSNRVADTLGKYLKASFKKAAYLKIDFKKSSITTAGLDMKDTVVYCINLFFQKADKCSASTGIEHCGTWGNQADVLLKNRLNETIEKLKIISVGKPKFMKYITKENFKEYWIQFKHKNYQGDCKK